MTLQALTDQLASSTQQARRDRAILVFARVATTACLHALHVAWDRWRRQLEALKVLRQRQGASLSVLTRALLQLRVRRLWAAWRSWTSVCASEVHQQVLVTQQKAMDTAVAHCLIKLREVGAKHFFRFALHRAMHRTRHAFAIWRDAAAGQFMKEQEQVGIRRSLAFLFRFIVVGLIS